MTAFSQQSHLAWTVFFQCLVVTREERGKTTQKPPPPPTRTTTKTRTTKTRTTKTTTTTTTTTNNNKISNNQHHQQQQQKTTKTTTTNKNNNDHHQKPPCMDRILPVLGGHQRRRGAHWEAAPFQHLPLPILGSEDWKQEYIQVLWWSFLWFARRICGNTSEPSNCFFLWHLTTTGKGV